ncbi:Dr1 associated protein 1 (negative cofactor 2 alpha) (predicted), isoform CRA_g [Rattus norvegicus]|uniref:Dr1 associated protein 1 (Negative cofactor 2 alpha) (Predicted), isoform CRA_g n=1 Tax=Rattus norvegicus TaxID=10116 RepID=A6HZ56_RAT|nr:Dr1 associated protein 1 (negative cofactor 2 alpha) (predicted), isoform CRA_g [Rattus norvegicus]
MQGDGEDNHTDGDKGPRRGRKPGSSGRKNGGTGSKSKDKKLSGTDSEQEVSEAGGEGLVSSLLQPLYLTPLPYQGSGLPREGPRPSH